MDHGIAPANLTVSAGWLPVAAAVGGSVIAALLAVLAAGRRAARVPPTHALTESAVEPRLLGPGRVIGGLLALAGAAPLFAVSATTSAPDTAAATSEMTALFLVAAVGFLGPIVARVAAGVLVPPLARLSPVGGFLASANLRTATRRFSSASTPLMLTVGLSCTLLFSSTTIDHTVTQERHAGLAGELAITSAGPGLPAAALADARAVPVARSAVALTPTTLGPSLGVSDDTIPAQILGGGQGGGLDVGVTAGSLRPCTATRSPSGAGAPTPRTPGSATACPSCSATGPARTPRSRRSTPARWRSATHCSPRAHRRPPDESAPRDDPRPDWGARRRRAAPAGTGSAVSGSAAQRARLGGHRHRRRP